MGLTDEKQTFANKSGHMKLGLDLVLNNVLHIPRLTCPLLSISQLLKDFICTMSFTSLHCAIHYRSSRILIGPMNKQMGCTIFKRLGP